MGYVLGAGFLLLVHWFLCCGGDWLGWRSPRSHLNPPYHEPAHCRPEIPLCESHAGRHLLVVRLRSVEGAAVLRWLPQGHRVHPGEICAHRGEDGRLVRLQALHQRPLLRRLARQALSGCPGRAQSPVNPLGDPGVSFWLIPHGFSFAWLRVHPKFSSWTRRSQR